MSLTNPQPESIMHIVQIDKHVRSVSARVIKLSILKLKPMRLRRLQACNRLLKIITFQKIGETDNLPLVMLISFADALFGCLLLVAADVELKQMFFKFVRMCCVEGRTSAHGFYR